MLQFTVDSEFGTRKSCAWQAYDRGGGKHERSFLRHSPLHWGAYKYIQSGVYSGAINGASNALVKRVSAVGAGALTTEVATT